jgi:Tol biopolymer transport system component
VQREPDGAAIFVRALGGGAETRLSAGADAIFYYGLSFSPSGDAVYAVRSDNKDPGFKSLYVLPRTGGAARLLIRHVDSPVGFAPDGHRFAYTRAVPATSVTELHVVSADGSGDRMLASFPAVSANFQPGPTWSPDGHLITLPLLRFASTSRYGLYAVKTDSGEVSELWQGNYAIGRSLWLPDATALLATMADRQGRWQLWIMPYPRGERRQLSNDLTTYEWRPDLSQDGRTLVAVAATWTGNLWALPQGKGSQPMQLTALSLPLGSIDEAPDGRLLTISSGMLWRFSADGHQRTAIDDPGAVERVAVCGPYLVVEVDRDNAARIVRLDADGTHPLQLAAGTFWLPACARGGRHVYFVERNAPERIFRVSIEGGTVTPVGKTLGDNVVGRLTITDDEATIIYAYEQFAPQPAIRLAVMPADGGLPRQVMDLPGEAYSLGAQRLSRDGKSLDYVIDRGGIPTMWEQPLDGGAPHQLLTFDSTHIADFTWSRDGTRLLLCRGQRTGDVMLVRNPAGRR